jgi:hypothetical protein
MRRGLPSGSRMRGALFSMPVQNENERIRFDGVSAG